MKFGYARVSTTDQNLEMQIGALEKYGVDKIFSDKATGKNMQRKEFSKGLASVFLSFGTNFTTISIKSRLLRYSLYDLIYLNPYFTLLNI